MVIKMENLTGRTIKTRNGQEYSLTELKGQGGQGVVYAETSGKYMVKLYYPSGDAQRDKELLKRLRFVKDVEKPANFVSILDLIDEPYIGYVMERVPEEYTSLNKYLIPDPKRPFAEWYNDHRGLRGRIFTGYIIAKAFDALSRQNLSYCDISGNNIFVRIDKNAGVRMIDIDNIYVAGSSESNVLGTPRYIAPEVVRRLRNPDVLSDNYSLAVILFELLRIGHPYIGDDVLEGSPEDEEKAYSGDGDYVTDDNSSNMLPSRFVMTRKLEELFRKCFVDGKADRMSRPSPRDFEFALLDASNKLIQCKACGAWHFPRKDSDTGRFEPCPWCDAPSKPKARLNFYNQLFVGESVEQAMEDSRELRKLINSFILREKDKNIIKNYYVMDIGTAGDGLIPSENYMCFPQTDKGYFAYNLFGKEGIRIRTAADGKWHDLGKNESFPLRQFDTVFFTFGDENRNTMTMDGTVYKYVRMAVLVEEEE